MSKSLGSKTPANSIRLQQLCMTPVNTQSWGRPAYHHISPLYNTFLFRKHHLKEQGRPLTTVTAGERALGSPLAHNRYIWEFPEKSMFLLETRLQSKRVVFSFFTLRTELLCEKFQAKLNGISFQCGPFGMSEPLQHDLEYGCLFTTVWNCVIKYILCE